MAVPVEATLSLAGFASTTDPYVKKGRGADNEYRIKQATGKVRTARTSGVWRHGRGLEGSRYSIATLRCYQAAPPQFTGRSEFRDTLSARSAGHRITAPSQHRANS